jgi:hypothetical protein
VRLPKEIFLLLLVSACSQVHDGKPSTQRSDAGTAAHDAGGRGIPAADAKIPDARSRVSTPSLDAGGGVERDAGRDAKMSDADAMASVAGRGAAGHGGAGGSSPTTGDACGWISGPAPASCDKGPCASPICGKNGMTYANLCAAQAASQTADPWGTCPIPQGHFRCGQVFCKAGAEYCTRETGDLAAGKCVALPPACQKTATPECGCVPAPQPCGPSCSCTECAVDSDGNMTLSCPVA